MDSPTFDEVQLPSVLIPAAQRLANASTHPFLPELPSVLSDMRLVQRGEGYHVGYAPTSVLPRLASSVNRHVYTINDRAFTLSHAVRKIGVYMYARDEGSCGKRKWRVEEVVERWPMRRYPKEALGSVGVERKGVLEGEGCVEWVESTPM
jgi:hypothetical protein